MKTLLVVIVIVTLLGRVNAYAEAINVAVLEFCPFVCNPEMEGGKPGFSIELEKAIFEAAGYEINFNRMPYVRSIKGTEKGTYDAVGFCNDKSSEVNICSTETIGPMVQTFYVKRGNPWRYMGIDSLGDINVGVISGYNYSAVSQDFQHYIEKHQDNKVRVEYHHGDGVLQRITKKILAGRTGTTNESEYVMDYMAKKIGIEDKLEKAGTFERILWGRMCFSPKYPNAKKYAKILDEGIRRMQASGELEKILQKYGLKPWN